ncbi:ABC transporter transmembrane region [Bosea lupini]|uniref:ABC transporter transmembrane region n=1 Tax=Bosea lupini TaxID=1036779 RepID=A0A1H7ZCT6_9HYPH|nr:type I secretion system permease/ATPase [Bosea lupini]SEM55319.1 ABC transporter transmembrane region [Bosea lupini]
MSSPAAKTKAASELKAALRPVGGAIASVAIASGVINLLMLTGPLFMLQVYDRVLPSRSEATLIGLSLFALAMFLFQSLFEVLRSRMLIRIGRLFADRVSPKALHVLAEAQGAEGLQAIRDLDTIRSFAGGGSAAFFDLPWTPLYVALCFAFHPGLGVAVLAGAVLLSLLTWAGDRLTTRSSEELATLSTARGRRTEEMRRNALMIDALGMRTRMQGRWLERTHTYLDRQDAAQGLASYLNAATRLLRTVLQSAVLALGAWLVIHQEASGGIMLAATILTIRALSPVELAIANWRGFVAARQSWSRLDAALTSTPSRQGPTSIALPKRELSVVAVSVAIPASERAVVANASFVLRAGSALGIVGPSGSGKSSLARAVVGVWPTARGVIRLDGATFDQWDRDVIGGAIGYLPQDVELLAGTVAENIARFAMDRSAEAVQVAAAEADVHEMILRLPDGYDTQVGEGGTMLSGGQRQRIGLARALFGRPFLVVLDEPNASLDSAGEQALLRAIVGIRQRGGIAIVIAHHGSALAAVDQLMVLNEGHVQRLGPRDEVLKALAASAPPQARAAQGKTRRTASKGRAIAASRRSAADAQARTHA